MTGLSFTDNGSSFGIENVDISLGNMADTGASMSIFK
jgi:hypothetical protein